MTGVMDLGEDSGACNAFAAHVDLLGVDTAIRALHSLEVALRSVFIERQPADEDEMSALAGEAHKLISTATAIGFLAVARACHSFEERCGSGAAGAAFERTRDIAVAALAEIGRLRAELLAATPAVRNGKPDEHIERTGAW